MEPYTSPATNVDTTATEPSLTHCGIGIAAFILSIISLGAIVVLIGIAGYMAATTPGGMDEQAPEVILLGLGVMFLGLVVFVSMVLSIVSLVRKDRKKLFGVLGLVFSAFTVLAVGGIMALGFAVG